jgi:hypothetical protein
LQQHFPDHHHSIDFIYWAELRDQILLHGANINFSQLVQDLLIDLVHEVPQLNLSLPLVETCFHLVQLAQSSGEQRMSSPVERFLDLTDSDNDLQPVSLEKVFRAVEKYHLDEFSGRKLAPNFANKYPSLDVTSSKLSCTSTSMPLF